MAAILLLPSLNECFFYDKVEQHGCFFFYRSVELFTAEGLVNLTYAALESSFSLANHLLPPNFSFKALMASIAFS